MQKDSVNIDIVDIAKYIPDFVQIRYSIIPNAGLGIFANTKIPAGTFIGNYMGEIYEFNSKPTSNDYLFESRIGNASIVFDADNLEKSNYTRFMNCCYSNEVENITVIRYKRETGSSVYITQSGKEIDIEGYVFFYAKREIEEGEELLYDYGLNYRNKLGIVNW